MGSDKLIDADNLMQALEQFASDRDWHPFHTPRNLVLALTGEVGELAEIFQWLTDDQAKNLPPADQVHLQEEIADVLLYLVRLASIMKIDLNQAVVDKLEKNALKYPKPESAQEARHD
jgi:NTP pyrophosphatase (non-canonical NTP hydrolase)